MDYWMRATRLTRCGSWCCWDVVVVVVAVTLAGAGWLADASSVDDFRYFPNEVPTFAKEIENATVPVGREATLSCVIYNLGNFKVAWVRVDTQTILTIDDMVITRSQRISVRHMTDASVDYPYYLHHPHQHAGHHKNNNRSLTVSEGSDHPGSRRQVAGAGAGAAGAGGSIHKTWQLIIREVQSSDAGLYMCQLNTEPMTSHTAYLSVTVPPDIVDSESSGDVMVTEGQNTTLRCSATGHPLPVITWRREDGRPIQNHAVTVEGSVLHLTRIPRQNIGAYLCIASNGVPPSVSKRFMLRVQFPPSVTATNQLVGARQGDINITLECHCESFPKPVVYWLRHSTGDVVVNGVKHREEKRETNHYKVSMQLVFLHLEREDFMAYQCVCRNTLGIADSVVRLYQIHPVADDGDMNEVYSEADQQDGRGTGKEQLSSTWDEKSKDDSSTKRLAANKQASAKTQLAVGGRSSSSAVAASQSPPLGYLLAAISLLLVSMTKTR
ncbi:hemicentin-1-like isoform X1 [Daphnia pulex]|uniref:hemicentin-1-like isoform X1 n=1 Tax=Daphnia pulex TaxID=6669 RepID=UPI001EE01751|nr:hemicentin-1-like isoform X1 [Daphnia pulex]XP_046451651.1 hemicentin-1-like isoform X1 [Daphnia pulex]